MGELSYWIPRGMKLRGNSNVHPQAEGTNTSRHYCMSENWCENLPPWDWGFWICRKRQIVSVSWNLNSWHFLTFQVDICPYFQFGHPTFGSEFPHHDIVNYSIALLSKWLRTWIGNTLLSFLIPHKMILEPVFCIFWSLAVSGCMISNFHSRWFTQYFLSIFKRNIDKFSKPRSTVNYSFLFESNVALIVADDLVAWIQTW